MAFGCACCDGPLLAVAFLGLLLVFRYVLIKAEKYLPSWVNIIVRILGYVVGGLTLAAAIFLGYLQRDESLRSWFFSKLCMTMNDPNSPMAAIRCDFLSGVQGSVVEFGSGPLANLACLRDNVKATSYLGVEPNTNFKESVKAGLQTLPYTANVLWEKADKDNLHDVADNSIDSVIGTHLLSSVEDPDAVLAEAYRILKSGGIYYGLEHVSARQSGTFLDFSQRMFAPILGIVGNGCKFKPLWENFERTQLKLAMEDFDAPIPIPMLRPHIMVKATKR